MRTKLVVEEFDIGEAAAPGSGGPYGITAGPDGALWFTLVHAGVIGRLEPPEGRLAFFPLNAPDSGPTVITPGPDGALWFCRTHDHRIGRITADGATCEFALDEPESGTEFERAPGPDSARGPAPYGIAAGPDGALWFTETTANRIGRITVTGEVTRLPLPVPGAFPSAITAGADGALWCTLNQADALARITTAGEITSFPLPTRGAAPVGIAADVRGGAVWFAEIGAGAVGRIDATGASDTSDTSGGIREFPLSGPAARPHAVAVDSAGACWVTQWGANRIGRITPDGTLAEAELPTPSAEPHGLTVGPDGAVWAALEKGALARVTVSDQE